MQALTLMLLLLQAPGDGWALAQVPAREVKTLYWDLFGTTETWVSIIPAGPEGGPPLVRLIFQAFFVGKEVKEAPSRLALRALGLPLTLIKEYSLRLVIDKEMFDLGASCMALTVSRSPCQLLFPVGENSSANGVMIDVPRALLERLAGAHTASGTALGFPIVLSSDDRAALARFAAAIHVTAAPRD